MPRTVYLALALVVCVGALNAAVSEPTTSATASGPAPDKSVGNGRPTIVAGMSADEIVQAIGKPERIKPMTTEAVAKAEIWVYTYTKVVGTKQVLTGTKAVAYSDPITGAVKTIDEPVYGIETVRVSETTELLMVDDRLVEAKRYRAGDRDYH